MQGSALDIGQFEHYGTLANALAAAELNPPLPQAMASTQDA
jgi:hypothetical protein